MKFNIKPPNYVYCPFCGKKLDIRLEENKKRKYCLSCNWTYYPHVASSVGAVILDGEKVLLVKRSREPYINTWMFPAGFVDYGEHPEETLQREVKEEVGLEIESYSLLGVWQSEDDPRSHGHFMFFYKVKVKKGVLINNDSEENSRIGWFDLKKIPKIGWKAHREIMAKLKLKEITFEDLGQKNL